MVQATVICDGPSLGVECAASAQSDMSLSMLRASLRSLGWTRRHHRGADWVVVDLCPSCSKRAKPTRPVFTGGRPRKVPA